MASLTKSNAQKPTQFLPDGMGAFLKKWMHRLVGLFLLALTLIYLLSLISYNPSDPSWNTVSHQTPENYLSYFGSALADLMFQMVGDASFALVIILLGWSWRFLTATAIKRPGLRSLAGLISLTLLASLIGISQWLFKTSFLPYMGGVIGHSASILSWNLQYFIDDLTQNMLAWQDPSMGKIMIWSLMVIIMGLTFFSLSFATGLRKQEWAQIFNFIGKYGRALYYFITQKAVMPSLPNISAFKSKEKAEDATEFTPSLRRQRKSNHPMENEGDDFFETPPKAALGNSEVALDDNDDSGDNMEEGDAPRVKARKDKSPSKPSHQTRLDFSEDYALPGIELINLPPPQPSQGEDFEASLEQNARQLELVLQDFGVKGSIIEVCPGPVVTLYALEPAPGIKAARVIGLADDVARSMSARSVRIATIPGRNVIGIELPNTKREIVPFYDLLASKNFNKSKAILPLILGKDIAGTPQIVDLASMPHLLIAGTTGSGKSVGLNAMILSLLYRHTPEQCRFIMIDPKMLELSVYNDIPHLLAPVVTDPKKAVVALKWSVREMEDRYRAISRLGGVRNIDAYNKKVNEILASGEEITRKITTGIDPDTGQPVFEEIPLELTPLPYIVVVVDEMADLMLVAGKEIEASIQRLAQMARAAGIHIIMATQRPSVDVITGTIKANFPTRISFALTSKIDARTVMGENGAEQLLGKGDMLVKGAGGAITRVHGPFVEDDEVEHVCDYIRTQGSPNYFNAVTDENDTSGGFETDVSGASNVDFIAGAEDGNGGGEAELYDQAVAFVAKEGRCSTSLLQRNFRIGYNRAADLVDRLEREGVISSANHAGKRQILIGDHSV